MSTRRRKLTRAEIAAALPEAPAVLSLRQLAVLLGKSRKTIYWWLDQGRLDGAFRKRWQAHLAVARPRP